ncbi:MAG: FtsX-like permease family protein, partial [Gemmatimonadetes bacterium]|nr:FtsX-like permease family protein [Gemmatimonadota bacterium]
QQLLTEHMVLAVAGGLLGLLIAWLGIDLLTAFASRFTARAAETSMSGPVLLFTLALSMLTGLLFGAAPAMRAGIKVADDLRDGRGMSGGRRGNRLQGGLVVTQLALAFTLLVGSGLLVRSFYKLQQLDPGYDPENVLSMRVVVNARNSSMNLQERQDFFLTVLDRIGALPGVTSVALTDVSPMQFQQGMFHGVRPEGARESDGTRLPQAQPRSAGVGYFQTAGIPLKAGRTFETTDDENSLKVSIVNEALAASVWPGQDPIGMRYAPCNMMGGCSDSLVTVIGVVGNVHEFGLETSPPAQIYLPVRQAPGASNLVVRTAVDPLQIGRQAREIIKALDPTIPVANVTTFAQIRDDTLAPRRLTLTLLSIFAGVALVLSLAGIAGVIAFGVSQRTHEIGIRMALGAQRDTVMRSILRRGMVLVVMGLGLGAVGSIGLVRLISGLLWGVPKLDPLTFILTGVILGAMGMAACYVPGRKATRIDPVVAFRSS